MHLRLRPATEADIPFLMALRQQTMDQHLAASGADTSLEAHRARVDYHFDCASILEDDQSEPVGLLKVRRLPDAWEIVQIQLAPQFAPVHVANIRALATAGFEHGDYVARRNQHAAVVFHRDHQLLRQDLLRQNARPAVGGRRGLGC